MKFYVVDAGIIVNLIVAESKEIAESITGLLAIDVDDASVAEAGVGAVYDDKLDLYVYPEAE